ncbi:error-prone DNA polymerase [uncultured Pseudacidovorax sp.]|uniref:error-prone DNA polymerase n=1 Tax=uncultured Pseudacidovorax sp. TaxID=679313 RepID=UPI0025CF1199|nr:error-prone DNA polymerase [uncultured Pseudacidovorax sp.]
MIGSEASPASPTPPPGGRPGGPGYAELAAMSGFSYLRAASRPAELVGRAKELGYDAIAVVDDCSVAGVVQAWEAAREEGLKVIVGAQFRTTFPAGAESPEPPAPSLTGRAAAAAGAALQPAAADDRSRLPWRLIVLAQDAVGYARLCQFITSLRRSSGKGSYRLDFEDLDSTLAAGRLAGCALIALPDGPLPGHHRDQYGTPETSVHLAAAAWDEASLTGLATWLERTVRGPAWLGACLLAQAGDAAWLQRLRAAARAAGPGVRLVAVGDVRKHRRSRAALRDVLTAVRIGRPLTACGAALPPNAEQHMRTRLRLSLLYPPDLLAESLVIARRCTFDLAELRYQYPAEVVPAGETPDTHLRRLTYEGAGRRWPAGIEARLQELIEHELKLIAELQYAHYFLTVADLVAFARSRNILCQGRGSAANSVVCYCLGVTEVDPGRMSVLFERFISKERNEPPDIDVDFEHQRREEVMQYLYQKYGRDRAGLTGVQTRYRTKSAVRDVAKALGFSAALQDRLTAGLGGVLRAAHAQLPGAAEALQARLVEVLADTGVQPDDLAMRQLVTLAGQLLDMPRHLSQHPGGFVLTKGPLSSIVPIENAAMEDRTVIQWDKDDLDALGLLKVDVLALGMLSAIRRTLDFVSARLGRVVSLQDIPAEDEATYDMICKADTVGVFQIESRAQMSMLPRMRPRTFYDLVIEVAIVRPGPIQGGMVHPLLARREGREPVTYPSEALREALGRTMGVPVFQEQVMQIAVLAAGFTPGEADQLRRAMAAWRRKGGLQQYYGKIVDGMTSRGYTREFAESIFEQIKGFSEYGFPESHAASFALLVYASCWLKCHFPAEFLAALLNSQPMGFYTPSQLVQDAQRHDVPVLPVDVSFSDWDCTVQRPGARRPDGSRPRPAVQLGLRLVHGLSKAAGERIEHARAQALFTSVLDLARRAGLDRGELDKLAAADALASLSGHRRQQVWDAAAARVPGALLAEASEEREEEAAPELPEAAEGEAVVWDYRATGLTLRSHPLALLRPQLYRTGALTAAQLLRVADGAVVRACGLVTLRQQPETAKGVLFLSLEDETGPVQVICWPKVKEQYRQLLDRAALLLVKGRWQCRGEARSLIASGFEDLTATLGDMPLGSRDYR